MDDMFRRVVVPQFSVSVLVVACTMITAVFAGPMGEPKIEVSQPVQPAFTDVDINNHTLLGEVILAREVVTRNRWGTPMPPDGKGSYSLIAPLNPEFIEQSLIIPPTTGGPVFIPKSQVRTTGQGSETEPSIDLSKNADTSSSEHTESVDAQPDASSTEGDATDGQAQTTEEAGNPSE